MAFFPHLCCFCLCNLVYFQHHLLVQITRKFSTISSVIIISLFAFHYSHYLNEILCAKRLFTLGWKPSRKKAKNQYDLNLQRPWIIRKTYVVLEQNAFHSLTLRDYCYGLKMSGEIKSSLSWLWIVNFKMIQMDWLWFTVTKGKWNVGLIQFPWDNKSGYRNVNVYD